ncbi:MAG: O-antigen ligase domain-containing protein [Pseudanabaenaceae cyanobacterium]
MQSESIIEEIPQPPTEIPNLQMTVAPLQWFKPAPVWLAISIYIFAIVFLFGIGSIGSKILAIVYPLGAFLVGWLLYFHYPATYFGFVWFLFFLTPLIRRLADWRANAFSEPSPILLAPYLAAFICIHTVIKYFPKSKKLGALPWALALSSIGYGYLLGLMHNSPVTTTVNLFQWSVPVMSGMHLFLDWRNYPNYRRSFQITFTVGTLIMGAYGIFQYIVAPEWDKFWLISAPSMISSAGSPEPFGIRVWSTMNSPGPFANSLMAGLLVLFSMRGNLVLPAALTGYLSFLLSLVRSCWISWFLGVVVTGASLSPKQQMRLFAIILGLVVLLVPLASIEPFSNVIGKRVSTLSNLQEDGSAKERKALYTRKFDPAFESIMGTGIGGQAYDSAFLMFLFQLGWVGSLPYLGSLILLICLLVQDPASYSDTFVGICRAVALGGFLLLAAYAAMLESPGMILWNFLSLGLAGGQYIKHHRKLEENWWHWHQWQNQASRLAAQREKERLEETETEERLKPAGYD